MGNVLTLKERNTNDGNSGSCRKGIQEKRMRKRQKGIRKEQWEPEERTNWEG